MFDTLTDRFDGILGRLKGKGRLSNDDVAEAMREIRLALLEADVHFNVVKQFVEATQVRCLDAEVTQSLTPGQQVVKIVNEELTTILGGESFQLSYAQKPPTVVLMAGLQGSGKTTSSAKLARWLKSQGRNPLLVGADFYPEISATGLICVFIFTPFVNYCLFLAQIIKIIKDE